MDAFSYLSVLISIVLGLGMTQLLTGLGRLIQVRARVRQYWPVPAWAVLLLVVHVQTWWSMFGLRDHDDWNFFAFLLVLAQPAVLYLAAALALPDVGDTADADDDTIDLRRHYYGNARWIFGTAVALLGVSILKDLVLAGSLPEPVNVAAHVVFAALWTGAALTRRETYHKLLPVVTAALLTLYIALLFARLP